MKIIAIIFAGALMLITAGLFFLGSVSPETSVYMGRQVPKKYMAEIKALNLLEEGEKIKYFYTDAMYDIKDGFYFVSDRKLVLFNQEWSPPKEIVPFERISAVDITYDNSFITDSYIFLKTIEGYEMEFPVSSEKGRDTLFYEYLKSKILIDLEPYYDYDESLLEPETVFRSHDLSMYNEAYKLIVQSYFNTKVADPVPVFALLLKKGEKEIFSKEITPELFEDDLPDKEYWKFKISDVVYSFVRTNRLYFDVTLKNKYDSSPDRIFRLAIFYKSSKKGELSYSSIYTETKE